MGRSCGEERRDARHFNERIKVIQKTDKTVSAFECKTNLSPLLLLNSFLSQCCFSTRHTLCLISLFRLRLVLLLSPSHFSHFSHSLALSVTWNQSACIFTFFITPLPFPLPVSILSLFSLTVLAATALKTYSSYSRPPLAGRDYCCCCCCCCC